MENLIIDPDTDDNWSVVLRDLYDNVCHDGEMFDSYSKRMSDGERIVMLLYFFVSEVANGGIEQFIENDSGDYFDDVCRGLVAIGADIEADSLNRVRNVVFNGNVSRYRNERCGIYDHYSEVSDMEDDENSFFDDINSYFGWCENIHWLTCKYINEHPDDFKRVGL